MKARLEYAKYSPGAIKAMYGLMAHLNECGLEKGLLFLVYLRASQINGCAYCIDMHVTEATAHGESPTRLHLLSVWRETPLFSEREQAALAWTEAVTQITAGRPSDELYDSVQKHFTNEETVNLNLAVVAINGWNRFAVSFQKPPLLNGSKEKI